jgi:hypothetical protein
MTPFGPCGTVAQIAPGRFGFNTGREYDTRITVFSNLEDAKGAAWGYCDDWYRQEKASREVFDEAKRNSEGASVSGIYLDVKKPLFTKDGALACPSWAALVSASAARDKGWTYPGGIAGAA